MAIDKETQKLIDEIAQNPIMDAYVRLKPKDEEPPPLSKYIDWLFAYADEMIEAGLDPGVLAKALDGDVSSQSAIASHFLRKISEREDLLKSGQTHAISRNLAISDIIINAVTFICLDSAADNDSEISSKLVKLIGVQLGVTYESLMEDLSKKTLRNQAKFVAAELVLHGITPSYRKVAKIMEVEASTVTRWFPDGSLISQAKALSEFLKETMERFHRERGDFEFEDE